MYFDREIWHNYRLKSRKNLSREQLVALLSYQTLVLWQEIFLSLLFYYFSSIYFLRFLSPGVNKCGWRKKLRHLGAIPWISKNNVFAVISLIGIEKSAFLYFETVRRIAKNVMKYRKWGIFISKTLKIEYFRPKILFLLQNLTFRH